MRQSAIHWDTWIMAAGPSQCQTFGGTNDKAGVAWNSTTLREKVAPAFVHHISLCCSQIQFRSFMSAVISNLLDVWTFDLASLFLSDGWYSQRLFAMSNLKSEIQTTASQKTKLSTKKMKTRNHSSQWNWIPTEVVERNKAVNTNWNRWGHRATETGRRSLEDQLTKNFQVRNFQIGKRPSTTPPPPDQRRVPHRHIGQAQWCVALLAKPKIAVSQWLLHWTPLSSVWN